MLQLLDMARSVLRISFAAILFVAGFAKINDPDPAMVFLLNTFLLPVDRGAILALGASELALGAWVISKRFPFAAALCVYASLVVFGSVHYVASGLPESVDCGCFGSTKAGGLVASWPPEAWMASTWSLAALSLVLLPWKRIASGESEDGPSSAEG